jgi:hypothetical protein
LQVLSQPEKWGLKPLILLAVSRTRCYSSDATRYELPSAFFNIAITVTIIITITVTIFITIIAPLWNDPPTRARLHALLLWVLLLLRLHRALPPNVPTASSYQAIAQVLAGDTSPCRSLVNTLVAASASSRSPQPLKRQAQNHLSCLTCLRWPALADPIRARALLLLAGVESNAFETTVNPSDNPQLPRALASSESAKPSTLFILALQFVV